MNLEGLSKMENAGKGISGSTLKLIAIVSMLVDHVAATVIYRMIISRLLAGNEQIDGLYMAYGVMRQIGRIAFPVFCFLMVEGVMRTHSKGKYLFRMGMFALISEIPFDLALSAKWLEFQHQNVYFTLFLGLLGMVLALEIEKRLNADAGQIGNLIIQKVLVIANFGVLALIAELLHTDYSYRGVLCIMVLYLFRKNKSIQCLAGAVSFTWEIAAVFAFIPVFLYNGKRGLNLKYVFYMFYPVHLLILYLICVCLGINGIVIL